MELLIKIAFSKMVILQMMLHQELRILLLKLQQLIRKSWSTLLLMEKMYSMQMVINGLVMSEL